MTTSMIIQSIYMVYNPSMLRYNRVKSWDISYKVLRPFDNQFDLYSYSVTNNVYELKKSIQEQAKSTFEDFFKDTFERPQPTIFIGEESIFLTPSKNEPRDILLEQFKQLLIIILNETSGANKRIISSIKNVKNTSELYDIFENNMFIIRTIELVGGVTVFLNNMIQSSIMGVFANMSNFYGLYYTWLFTFPDNYAGFDLRDDNVLNIIYENSSIYNTTLYYPLSTMF